MSQVTVNFGGIFVGRGVYIYCSNILATYCTVNSEPPESMHVVWVIVKLW
jgi:hypothetical protein